MRFLSSLWKLYEKIVRVLLKAVLRDKLRDETAEKIVNFADFCLVGALSAVVSLACYYLIVLINRRLYLLGYSVGFVLSVLNSYFWNSNFVFQQKDDKTKTIAKTYASYGVTFLLGNALLYLMVDVLKISELIAPLIQILVITPVNYLLNKKWVYRQ